MDAAGFDSDNGGANETKEEDTMAANLKIMTDDIEREALEQCESIAASPAFDGADIRIMPDVHAGKGCVIGFTAKNWRHLIPNLVGVDIGCGMLAINLGAVEIDFARLDETIAKRVPSGFGIHEQEQTGARKLFERLNCIDDIRNANRIAASLGTLGGGNHFIELDVDDAGNVYLAIHTGSRNLGKQVCEIYQRKAVDFCGKHGDERTQLIEHMREQGRHREISETLKRWQDALPAIANEQAWLSDADAERYMDDMAITQKFAVENRDRIARAICEEMGWRPIDKFETIHNYIDMDDRVIRKGAIRASRGKKVLIPLNMADGCIIGIGKGNADWNESAPHGAGRIMSRSAAKGNVTLDAFIDSMKGIYTTSVCEATIDESPFAYKPADEIVDLVTATVDIADRVRPIYNYKAH